MGKITIFTPTYNRKNKLEKLYESLKLQSSKSFQWLIVDDGSTDDTRSVVKQWVSDAVVEIRYFRQENQGKCMALKMGIEHCQTPWFICVDSDDTLRPDAVQCLLEDIQSGADGHIGFIYPRQTAGAKLVKWLPDDVRDLNIMDIKNLYGITETAIALRTDYLRLVQIPCFDNERFLSEEVIYIQLAKYGKVIPVNKAFYEAEYQEDGLTKRLFHHWAANPQGTLLLLQLRYQYSAGYPAWVRLRERIKCILNLNALCITCGLRIGKNTPSKVYSAVLYLPSWVWKKIRFS